MCSQDGRREEYGSSARALSNYNVVDIAGYIENGFGVERSGKFQKDMKKQMGKLRASGNAFRKIHKNYFSKRKSPGQCKKALDFS